MIVYRVMYQTADGVFLKWGETRAAADALAANLRRDGHQAGVRKVEVPTDRAGLVQWLNINYNSDNG